MKIAEPATVLTDYALSISGIVFGVSLWMAASRPIGATLWAIGFLVTAVSAALGGTFHGFRPRWTDPARTAVWNVTLSLIGVGTGFMISGTIAASPEWGDPVSNWLLAGLGLSIAGIVIQQGKWRLHRHFNHNDLYHTIQIVALYLFYRGAALIG